MHAVVEGMVAGLLQLLIEQPEPWLLPNVVAEELMIPAFCLRFAHPSVLHKDINQGQFEL